GGRRAAAPGPVRFTAAPASPPVTLPLTPATSRSSAPAVGPAASPAIQVAGHAIMGPDGVARRVAPDDGATPVVALTFDDGPDPRWTPQVLAELRQAGIRATFCLVGVNVRRHPELVRAIHDAGHVLCDHTEHHDETLDRAGRDRIESEIGPAAAEIHAAGGDAPRFYRPPGGRLSAQVVDVARLHSMPVLAWSMDPRDWKGKSAADIRGYVLAGVRPGYVILLHDGGGDRSPTVAEVPDLIRELTKRGLKFTTP